MSSYTDLIAILKELLNNRFYPKPQYIRGLLGDGNGNVVVPDREDYNYVRFNRSSSEKFEVFNKEVSQPVDGWPILIGEFPWSPGLIQVVGTDWAAYSQTGWGDSVASIQAHAPTHEWPTFAPGSDPVNVYLRALTPLRTQVVGSGSNSVYVTSYEYDWTGTTAQWPGVPSVDFSAKPPTGSMLYMGVYLNPATNALGVVSGSTTVFTDALEPATPNWPLGVFPSGYVRLYGGQAGITERDIRPAQRIYNTTLMFTGTSGGGGGAPSGPAGGDLTGTYPDPRVVSLNTYPILGVPAGNQFLMFTGSAWRPSTIPGLGAASESTAGIAELATQAETDAGTDDLRIVTPLKLSSWPPALLEVKNTSGFTVVANNVGYVVYTAASGLEFVYTSTVGQACVVVVGGANNATIKVATRGRYPLAYVGAAPAKGDFLFESFAFVDTQSYMSPNVIAIAMEAGSGGVVDAVMLTGSKTIPFSSTNNLLALVSISASDFVCTQNGAPSGANITYNAPSSGAENTINPTLSTELGKIVIHNTTRGTEAYLQATNTATNVMTFTAAGDVSAWQNGDTLSARSLTNTDVISSAYFYDIAITSTELPALTTAVIITAQLTDTAASKFVRFHPWETGAASKRQVFPTQVASVVLPIMTQPISLYKKRFTIQWDANGSGTVVLSPLRLVGLVVATP